MRTEVTWCIVVIRATKLSCREPGLLAINASVDLIGMYSFLD
jgi:hypothetical protein